MGNWYSAETDSETFGIFSGAGGIIVLRKTLVSSARNGLESNR